MAQVAPYYNPSIGGVETVVQYISEELVRRGHEVHVLTSHRGHRGVDFYGVPKTDRINGVAVHRHASFLNVGHMSFLPGISRALWKGEFDVIHSHVYRHPHNEMALWVGRLKSTPIVLHGHSPFIAKELLRNGRQRMYRIYDFYARRFFLKKVGAIIALNEYEKDNYLKLGMEPERITMIGNAADEQCFDTDHGGRNFIEKYRLQGKRILLFVGNLNRAKRPDLLVEALPQVLEKFDNVMAVLVGMDEGMEERVRQKAELLKVQDHYLWTGPLCGMEKMHAYQAADMFILPSDSEVFGLVLVEAMAHGLPVVGSDAVGPSAIIDHGRTGLIFKRGAVSELAEAILSLLESPVRLRQMGLAARSTARKLYRVSSVVDRIESIYLRLVQDRRHRRSRNS